MNYGKAIKTLRSLRDMSQTDLSEKAQVSKSFLSKIEGGSGTPGLDKLEMIAEALDVPFYLLVFFASEKDDLHLMPVQMADEMKKHMFDMVLSIQEAEPQK